MLSQKRSPFGYLSYEHANSLYKRVVKLCNVTVHSFAIGNVSQFGGKRINGASNHHPYSQHYGDVSPKLKQGQTEKLYVE